MERTEDLLGASAATEDSARFSLVASENISTAFVKLFCSTAITPKKYHGNGLPALIRNKCIAREPLGSWGASGRKSCGSAEQKVTTFHLLCTPILCRAAAVH